MPCNIVLLLCQTRTTLLGIFNRCMTPSTLLLRLLMGSMLTRLVIGVITLLPSVVLMHCPLASTIRLLCPSNDGYFLLFVIE